MRAPSWQSAFGGLECPVVSPIPVRGRDPWGARVLFLHADVGRLTPEQLDRVVAHAAQRFGRGADEVRADILDPTHGLPILCDSDVLVRFELVRFE